MNNNFFIITIDTEADNQWDVDHECTTNNVKYLNRFQELAEKYDFKPVWLTTYEVANDDNFVNYFKNKQEKGLCEIGMHLHAWNTPPNYMLKSKRNDRSYLIEYPKDIMEQKIKNLDDLLIRKFNEKPISHRAGRWCTNEEYFDLLIKYGYKIDTSVTPHVDWSSHLGESGVSGSNYINEPEKVYFIKNELMEVPMTIRIIHNIQIGRIKSIRSFLGEIKRLIVGRTEWIRPDKYLSFSGIKKVIKECKKNNEYIMFMIHSSELMPGGSPNFPNEESIEKLYLAIEKIFNMAKENGYEGITLKDFYTYNRKEN